MSDTVFVALQKSQFMSDCREAFRETMELSLRLLPKADGTKASASHPAEHPLCRLLSHDQEVCIKCSGQGRCVSLQVGAEQRADLFRCRMGLVSIEVAVRVDGRHVGNLVVGPLSDRPPTERGLQQLAGELRRLGIAADPNRVRDWYYATRVSSSRQLQGVARLMGVLAGQLGHFGGQCLIARSRQDTPAVARTKQLVLASPTGRVSLQDAARHAHLNKDYFCRLFKRATGMGFSEYVGRVRVEKAKDLLAGSAVRVGEVAFAIGFESLTHFNHVFRKYVGMTPTKYRQAVRRNASSFAKPLPARPASAG